MPQSNSIPVRIVSGTLRLKNATTAAPMKAGIRGLSMMVMMPSTVRTSGAMIAAMTAGPIYPSRRFMLAGICRSPNSPIIEYLAAKVINPAMIMTIQIIRGHPFS